MRSVEVEKVKVKQIFMDTDDLAHYMNISKSLVYRLVSDHGIPHFRVGSLIRFKKHEVDKWLERQKGGERPEIQEGHDETA